MLPFAPGGGFQIYRNPMRSTPLSLDDFAGSFVQWSGGSQILGHTLAAPGETG